MLRFTGSTNRRRKCEVDLSELEGKKILVTGASGLIGRTLVSLLLTHKGKAPIQVVALVRNEEKARRVFSALPQNNLEYLVSDVCNLKPQDMGIDYIIHGANQTASKAFTGEPVEVILGAVAGTKNVLEFARVNPVKSVVYLSTMEVYGAPTTDDKIDELAPTDLNTMSVRSSYPESKRLCECLCASYASQYGVPVKVVRLTQTFGEGVSYHDGRVFAEFARCVIEGRDIVLKTKGETKRNYLYTVDAAEAIFTVLLHGTVGQAYNAANEATYCSIYEMAQMVAEKFGGGKVQVQICEENDLSGFGYAPVLKMNLDCKKLKDLGWCAKTSLEEAYKKMIVFMKENSD